MSVYSVMHSRIERDYPLIEMIIFSRILIEKTKGFQITQAEILFIYRLYLITEIDIFNL